jgi:hypothetical protein
MHTYGGLPMGKIDLWDALMIQMVLTSTYLLTLTLVQVVELVLLLVRQKTTFL